MKTRKAFVANSSSSSFIIISVGNAEIQRAGSGFDGESDCTSMDIDNLIDILQKAKEEGIKRIDFEFGGGYDS